MSARAFVAATSVALIATAGAEPAPECAQPLTPIPQIQGSGASAVISGAVTTYGLVVGDYELPGGSGQIRGFYLQDPLGDGDPATSDGIFVFTNGSDRVSLGQVVRVSGEAGEFQGQTQISGTASNPLTITPCGTGTLSPVDVVLPVPPAVAGVDYLERYEGMLVRFPQPLYVTELFQLGRFGQLVLSSGDRLYQPTSVALPGASALAVQAANNLNRIILDDANNLQNADPIVYGRGGSPLTASNTLRGGDTVTDLTGVLVYGWGGNSASPNAYRVRAVGDLSDLADPSPGDDAPVFQPTNPRPPSPPAVSGPLRVSAFNVLNYFLTVDPNTNDAADFVADDVCGPGIPLECRGADNRDGSGGSNLNPPSTYELERQQQKLIEALVRLDADVLGLIEIENTAGVEPVADLVGRMNGATGAGTYAYIDTGTIGSDAIRVGLIYKPGKVAPVGGFETLDSSDDPRFDSARMRPSLAQTFRENASNALFTVVVNHFKSKNDSGLGGASGPCTVNGPGYSLDCDQGDGQGFWNHTRNEAAKALVAWVQRDPTGSGDPDYLIIGDLNSYAREDPIRTIEAGADAIASSADDYVNLILRFNGPTAYSYVFDGQWGYLDHALASPSLAAQVAGAATYAINADEPSVLDYNVEFKSAGQVSSLFQAEEYRTSDHDPVIVGLDLSPAGLPGDVDGDGDVDRNDVNLVVAARNTSASGPSDPRDLNGDGRIDVLDARLAVLACSLPRCAIVP